MGGRLPVRKTQEGVAVSLRVTPRAGANRVEGVGEDAEGRLFLRVRVTDAPEKGKANAAVIRLLAKTWRLPRSAFEVVAGESDRNKSVAVKGDPEALAGLIEDWFAQAGSERDA